MPSFSSSTSQIHKAKKKEKKETEREREKENKGIKMKKQEVKGCLPLKQTAIYTTQKRKNKNCQGCREVRKYEEKKLKKIQTSFCFLFERKMKE